MKKILTILLLLPALAFAQTDPLLSVEAGTNLTSNEPNGQVALMGGFVNWKDDMFSAGVVVKRYDMIYRPGMRIGVNLMLNKEVFFYTLADAFFQKNVSMDAQFLEIGAGVGVQFWKLRYSVGYQMNDYNPSTNLNLEDQIVTRLTYNLKL